jgi:hypothetical protein
VTGKGWPFDNKAASAIRHMNIQIDERRRRRFGSKKETAMKFKDAVNNILLGLSESLKRFPITIILSTAVAVMLIIISERHNMNNTVHIETLTRLTMIFALGIPLSLCIKLFCERMDIEKKAELIGLFAASSLVLLLYYFLLLNEVNMVSITRYTAVSLALYLGFLFIPYLPRKEHFEMYIIKIGSGFFITIIYSIVLYVGLAAIIMALNQLLGVHFISNIYTYTAIIVACVFAPAHFLAAIPRKDSLLKQEYSKLLKILLLYIVMPLLTAYTTILCIYFIKIIVIREWPVGLVSHLVLWPAVIVAIVLLLITPLQDEDKWAKGFLRWMPKAMLPVLIMMFVSVWIRVNAYGVTENRYYVLALAIWVFAMMLYFAFIKKRSNIILPVTLAVIALLSVFGPWSSYSISVVSQNNRLEAILVRNDMLQDGEIQKAPPGITEEDKQEINDKLAYFNRDHTLQEAKYLPTDFQLDDMESVFGFPFEGFKSGSSDEFYYFINKHLAAAVDVKEYDFMFDTRNLYNGVTAGSAPQADYDRESCVVRLSDQDGELLYEKNLKPFIKLLLDKHKATGKENALAAEEMTLVDENEKVKVKFVFLDISGNENSASREINSKNAEFYLFVKIK